ncbi:hypothetical protein D3C72_2511720 [compost metagenome]
MKRLEYLLAFGNRDARPFITDLNRTCRVDPDRDCASAARMIDCIAQEVDDRHLDN